MGLLDGAAVGAGANAFMDAYGLSSGVRQRDERMAKQDRYRQQVLDANEQYRQQQLGMEKARLLAEMQPKPVKWEPKQIGDNMVAYNPYTQETKVLGPAPKQAATPKYDMFAKPGGGVAYLPEGGNVPQGWVPYEKKSGVASSGGYSYDKLIADIEGLDGKIASLEAGVGIASEVTSPQRQVAINRLKTKRNQMLGVAKIIADKGGFTFPYGGTAQNEPKQLTTDKAREFLQQAGGDKTAARRLAKEQGYVF